jgi:hypothetical protein
LQRRKIHARPSIVARVQMWHEPRTRAPREFAKDVIKPRAVPRK